MSLIFADYINKFVKIYLDDVLLYFETYQLQLDYLYRVFDHIRQSKLYCEFKKCEFGKHWIKYLGHKISDSIVFIDPAKTEAIGT